MTITFKQFLNEATPKYLAHIEKSWSEHLPSKEQAINWIIHNNKDMLENGNLLFRGDDRLDGITFIRPHMGDRNSTTSNIYQFMMDGSDSLSNFPSRSRSLICSTRAHEAANYGTVFLVFPQKHAMFAQTHTPDFIKMLPSDNLVKHFGHTLFLERISTLLTRRLTEQSLVQLHELNSREGFTSAIDDAYAARPEDLLSVFEFHDSELPGLMTQQEAIRRIGSGSAYEFLCDYFMTPESLGLQLALTHNIQPMNQEVWTESECMLIPKDMFSSLMPQLSQYINIDNYKHQFT